ncbi:MAG: FAD-dependent pyridine nucleotide-disulfide oxidoreductase [Bacteroidetes bacterium]|nr:FAD-dependent pyridine nucleotide-disulfide oxidoreductase [Bacteroidota bacterium]
MYDVIIIGSGPSGLACAIEATKAGLTTIVLEKGSLTDAIRRFPVNLVWFSTPEMLEIGGIPFVVSTVRPTRVDTLNYYAKVARHFKLNIRYYDAVASVSKMDDHFKINTKGGRTYAGMNVVVATGYFDRPNRINVPGENLPKVLHYYTEAFPYFDLNVAVIGGSNSAVEAALDLFRHGAHVTLIHRREKVGDRVKYWVVPDIQNRIKAGEITALFNSTVCEVRTDTLLVKTPGGVREVPNDFTFILTGFLPDTERLKNLGVRVDPETLVPAHDPKTLESNVPGLYLAGSTVAGKDNNQLFVENGRAHGALIVKSILAHREV